MTISLNLAGFIDFFLLETLTSFLLPFQPLLTEEVCCQGQKISHSFQDTLQGSFLQIFASAKASPVLIWISMIPGIIVLFYRLPLSMICYYTHAFIQTKSSYLYIFISFDPLKRDKQGWQSYGYLLFLIEIMSIFAQIDLKKCL